MVGEKIFASKDTHLPTHFSRRAEMTALFWWPLGFNYRIDLWVRDPRPKPETVLHPENLPCRVIPWELS